MDVTENLVSVTELDEVNFYPKREQISKPVTERLLVLSQRSEINTNRRLEPSSTFVRLYGLTQTPHPKKGRLATSTTYAILRLHTDVMMVSIARRNKQTVARLGVLYLDCCQFKALARGRSI